jgi:hypothetical protein
MKSCFPEDNIHSRVIITTRNDALALHCSLGASDHIYKIAASLGLVWELVERRGMKGIGVEEFPL